MRVEFTSVGVKKGLKKEASGGNGTVFRKDVAMKRMCS